MAILKQRWAQVGLLLWILTSLAGWMAVGGLISIPGVSSAVEYIAFGFVIRWVDAQAAALTVSLVMGLMVGLFCGVLQWLLLRLRLPRAGWWILVCLLGFALGWLTADLVTGTLNRIVATDRYWALTAALGWVVGGGLVGLAQWLVLRSRVSPAGWWIPTVALSSAAAWPLASLALRSVIDGGIRAGLIFLGIVGLVTGIATGVVLVLLLGREA